MNEADARTANLEATLSVERKQRTRLLDAFGNTAPCTRPTESTALAAASQAAPDLRSQLFQEINDMAGEFAEAADRNFIAGQACVAAYEVASPVP
jgi:hypothetical protein